MFLQDRPWDDDDGGPGLPEVRAAVDSRQRGQSVLGDGAVGPAARRARLSGSADPSGGHSSHSSGSSVDLVFDSENDDCLPAKCSRSHSEGAPQAVDTMAQAVAWNKHLVSELGSRHPSMLQRLVSRLGRANLVSHYSGMGGAELSFELLWAAAGCGCGDAGSLCQSTKVHLLHRCGQKLSRSAAFPHALLRACVRGPVGCFAQGCPAAIGRAA